MITKGSKIVLETQDAFYPICEVVDMSPKTLTVKYCAKSEMNRKTGVLESHIKIDRIATDKIRRMSERT